MQALPSDHRYALKFRDPGWFNDDTYGMLQDYGVAFCVYEIAGRSSPKPITADFTYVRLHGPGQSHQGCYDDAALPAWTKLFLSWIRSSKEVFCYFDNDQAGYAPQNALRLQTMMAANKTATGW